MTQRGSPTLPLDDLPEAAARHPSPNWRGRLFSPGLHVLLLAVLLSLTRLVKLEQFFRDVIGCNWCVANRAAVHEGQFLLALLALHAAARWVRHPTLRGLLRTLLLAALALAALDLMVLSQFYVRLTPELLLRFGPEAGAIGSHLRLLTSDPAVVMVCAVLAAMTGVVAWRYLVERPADGRRRSGWLFLMAVAGVLLLQPMRTLDFHTVYLRNPVESFLDRPTRNDPYSDDFLRKLSDGPSMPGACQDGQGARPNLIIVIVESLSLYQSRLFSGIHDWTPEFDRLATQGLRLTNFLANGVNTEQGLIALLTGEPPVPRPGQSGDTEFSHFNRPVDALPRWLQRQGYSTRFLTSGDLAFLNKGDWLKAIGFEQVEGHDAPFYRGRPRYAFDAASDDALYARALQTLAGSRARPTFTVLETVTTHAPYIDPVSRAVSQQGVVRYADAALGQFVAQLRQRGYFDNGALVIVGDHRSMTPVLPEERRRYGDRAFARVPLVVLGSGFQGKEEATFSQTDLAPSLRHWLGSGRQCVAANEGVFLPTTQHRPACSYTLRSYEPDEVVLACGTSDLRVKLDGDRTDYSGHPRGSPALLAELNRVRAGRGF